MTVYFLMNYCIFPLLFRQLLHNTEWPHKHPLRKSQALFATSLEGTYCSACGQGHACPSVDVRFPPWCTAALKTSDRPTVQNTPLALPLFLRCLHSLPVLPTSVKCMKTVSRWMRRIKPRVRESARECINISFCLKKLCRSFRTPHVFAAFW